MINIFSDWTFCLLRRALRVRTTPTSDILLPLDTLTVRRVMVMSNVVTMMMTIMMLNMRIVMVMMMISNLMTAMMMMSNLLTMVKMQRTE